MIIFTVCILLVNALYGCAASSDNLIEITRLSDQKCFSSRSAELKYSVEGKNFDTVNFVFEKLSSSNLQFWQCYCRVQAGSAEQSKISAGLMAFEESLHILPYSDSLFDIWVAYCTRKDCRGNIDPECDIEMVCSVLVDRECPITTHVGICRSAHYFLEESMPHKNLSILLHAFAARATVFVYGSEKYFMITRPSNVMENIFIQTLHQIGMQAAVCVPGDMKAIGLAMNANDQDILEAFKGAHLNNLEEYLWAVFPRGDRKPLEFARPKWFPYGDDKEFPYEHAYLLGDVPNIVSIDILALLQYWQKVI